MQDRRQGNILKILRENKNKPKKKKIEAHTRNGYDINGEDIKTLKKKVS